MMAVRFSDTDSFCSPPGLGKGRVTVERKEKKDCRMLAHFSRIPLSGRLRLMEREVMRKAHECFWKHFQDHKITGRKNVRSLAVIIFREAEIPSQAQTVAELEPHWYISLTGRQISSILWYHCLFLSFHGNNLRICFFSVGNSLLPPPSHPPLPLLNACSRAILMETRKTAQPPCNLHIQDVVSGEGSAWKLNTLGFIGKIFWKLTKQW